MKKLIAGEIAPIVLGERYHSGMLSKNVSTLFGNSDAKPAINGMREMTRSLADALEQLIRRKTLCYSKFLVFLRYSIRLLLHYLRFETIPTFA